jgi:hypothetical protein
MQHRENTSDLRRNLVRTMVTDDELAMIERVAAAYGGMSLSSAARLLILAGAAKHDPSLPPEGK